MLLKWIKRFKCKHEFALFARHSYINTTKISIYKCTDCGKTFRFLWRRGR